MKYVAYYRVSTVRQGASGLGLEAQQAAVRDFLTPGTTLVAEYTEVESGKKNNRTQLSQAIAAAKTTGARLLIAKLDRLSRNAAFIFALRDSGVDFVAVDIPDANALTVGIFAVMAQHERETISQRTKDALSAKKARGFKLGTPANLDGEARRTSLEIRQHNARAHKDTIQATDIILDKRQLGWTLHRIATHLNNLHYKTRRGCAFTPAAVQRMELAAAVASTT
jgi:DNA invertase Pin-like site-specific DNA recombinase